MAALYPFLYGDGKADPASVLDDVRRSTAAKAVEIVELRRAVLARDGARLATCATAMAERFAAGGRLFAFGNGGSSTDAQEVATTFLHPSSGRPLPALSLANDVAVVTALSNDVGFEVVFARQLAAFGRRADIAFGLSTSGGSANVLRAFEEADRLGMLTVGLAGGGAAPGGGAGPAGDGGKMAELGAIDHLFTIPSPSVHRIQEAQTTVYHVLWTLTQQILGSRHVPGHTG
jgi:D-sedoheptulose 7-phosphate isomerase